MNLIYIVDFPVNGNSGREKATWEKSAALAKNNAVNQYLFIADKPRSGLISKIFGKIAFDLSTGFRLMKKRDFVVVQRVLFLPMTRLILFLKGVTVISEYHADLNEEIPLMNKSSLQKGLLRIAAWFYNFNFRISHGIIYNHPYLQKKFDAIYNKPSIYSYNGSNYKQFYPVDEEEARQTLGIECNKTIFLFLGSVSQWHGVDYLIDIFNEEILKTETKVFLYVVGAKENQYTQELRDKISSNRIVFVPPVDTSTANYYINASNICLLPVKQLRTSPGSPLKLYDYIACGKPVITQVNLAGYSDEVSKFSLGYTCDMTDSRQAAIKIHDIAKNMEEIKYSFFRNNNRNVAINKVSWDRRMDTWCEFIKDFC